MARTSATKGSSAREAWAFVLVVFALSRLLFLGAGSLAAAYLVAALAVIVFGEVGVVLTGLVWISLGYVLFSQRGAAAGRSSRVT